MNIIIKWSSCNYFLSKYHSSNFDPGGEVNYVLIVFIAALSLNLSSIIQFILVYRQKILLKF